MLKYSKIFIQSVKFPNYLLAKFSHIFFSDMATLRVCFIFYKLVIVATSKYLRVGGYVCFRNIYLFHIAKRLCIAYLFAAFFAFYSFAPNLIYTFKYTTLSTNIQTLIQICKYATSISNCYTNLVIICFYAFFRFVVVFIFAVLLPAAKFAYNFDFFTMPDVIIIRTYYTNYNI